MLIVLDNMEQLAAAAADLSNLLGSTESVQVLVTSRRILGIRAERVYSLEPLAVPTDSAVTAAVELFLDRARSVRPSYQPSAEDLATSLSSPDVWTACRWRLSWLRHGCGCGRRQPCCNR